MPWTPQRSTALRAAVLPDVDEINWAGPTHAYGPAEDVPDLLRTLASAEPDQADEALANVTGSLFHQSTVHEATRTPRSGRPAVYAVAQCGDAIPVEVLRDRRAVEDSPEARASLLLALGLRGSAGDHSRHDSGDLATRVTARIARYTDPFSNPPLQASVLSQAHHRHQARARHQI